MVFRGRGRGVRAVALVGAASVVGRAGRMRRGAGAGVPRTADAEGRNRAARAARGDVAVFLDGDGTLLTPDVLAAHRREHARRTPVARAAATGSEAVSETAFALAVRDAWLS